MEPSRFILKHSNSPHCVEHFKMKLWLWIPNHPQRHW